MNIVLSEIERRHAHRKQISRMSQQILPPVISDPTSVKDHTKEVSEAQTLYQQACFLVETDMDALLYVLNYLMPEIALREERFKEIVSVVPMDKFVALRIAQQEDKSKEKRKEIPGQLHVGDEVTPKGKVKKGSISKVIDPAADVKQEAKETVA